MARVIRASSTEGAALAPGVTRGSMGVDVEKAVQKVKSVPAPPEIVVLQPPTAKSPSLAAETNITDDVQEMKDGVVAYKKKTKSVKQTNRKLRKLRDIKHEKYILSPLRFENNKTYYEM